MPFIHEDAEFDDLLRIVADQRGLAIGLVEKDYWVTHALWALQHSGFELWFKGGTSLSKSFGLIERFSEDLDLKLEPGTVADVPQVTDWTRESVAAIAARRAYFERLPARIDAPGLEATLELDAVDRAWRNANVRLTYPGRHLSDLGLLKPFVLLEIGSARVTPSVERDMTSFVHDYLASQGVLDAYAANRPRAVRCVHPLVTLLEKLDALHHRVPRPEFEPAVFVRHFEDAAHIIAAEAELPALAGYADVVALAHDLFERRQIRQLPVSTDSAFIPGDDERWDAIRAAFAAIAPMFWGPRLALPEACRTIREWIERRFGS